MSTKPRSIIASAPGKLLLAGEYAVLDGHPAVAMALGPRALARQAEAPIQLSRFLAAARAAVVETLGDDSDASRAAAAIVVDSTGFVTDAGRKLGLGSSAAVTAAAVGGALLAGGAPLEIDLAYRLTCRAHALAQGGRGSGVDVAAACFGGLFVAEPTDDIGPRVRPVVKPADLHMIAAYTGKAAHTPSLIDASAEARARQPQRFAAAIAGIARASAGLAAALDAGNAIACVEVIADANAALARLDELMKPPLRLPAHARIDAVARALGGAAKPTGAAGGDLAIAAFADRDAASRFATEMASAGILTLKAEPESGLRPGD